MAIRPPHGAGIKNRRLLGTHGEHFGRVPSTLIMDNIESTEATEQAEEPKIRKRDIKVRKNSGKTIQRLATAVFVVGIIISLFCAASTGLSLYQSYAYYGNSTSALILGIVAGVVIAAFGAFLSWIATRILHGYGELVQFAAEQTSYLEFICRRM